MVFDCDGVLADSEPAAVAAWSDVADRHGEVISHEEFESWTGKTDREMAGYYARRFGLKSEVLLDAVWQAFQDNAGSIRAFPDAMGLVGSLGRLPSGVGSNSSRRRLDFVLGAAGFSFEVTVAGDEVEHPKPAPDIYLDVMERLGVDPARTLVIEDSPTGLEAARRAGARTLAVDRGFFPLSLLEAAADRVVSSLSGG